MRVLGVMWVLDHLDDLESDFSVFHRVDDMYAMPAPRFFRLAERIAAYEGVMTARIRAEQAQEQPIQQEPGARIVEATPEAIRASELGPYVSFAQV
jgi:hypothetical protein